MNMQSPKPPDDDDRRRFGNIAAAVAVIALLAIAWFVFRALAANQAMENCRIEGRRDCDPIPIPNQ
jgi:hypothetical protein